MDQVPEKRLPAYRLAFLKARWHAEIVDQCQHAFVKRLQQQDEAEFRIDVFDVAGAFEIPLLAKTLAKSGTYDAITASAFVVDGGIYRHDFVADAVIKGLMNVQIETEVPIFSAVLTPHHFHESSEHRTFFHEHFQVKGREVADACASLLELMAAYRTAA
ncbi:MAG: 6,7-dimethyl-8-ribityllumazine synthase [Pseudomonadota bacterium]